MTTYNYKPGLGNAASYEVSGIPYVTGGLNPAGGEIALSFPRVTRWVVVSNTDATAANTVKIGFSSNGVGGSNYYLLSGSQTTPRLEVKVLNPIKYRYFLIYIYINYSKSSSSVDFGLYRSLLKYSGSPSHLSPKNFLRCASKIPRLL